MDQALIFCRTKIDCDNLEDYLKAKGKEYSCATLHGDKDQKQRVTNLNEFKAANIRFLICTDVAARGIDISQLPFMISMFWSYRFC